MDIKISKLILENFKGLKSFTLDLDGQNAVVRGDNGTGKSTLMDSFLWLLFGKDSQGQANFEIKTLDESGQVIHGLDHSVEAHLLIDDRPLVLRKVYKEKWTKKRGSANAVLTGHTIDHYIDGVPVKAGEFSGKIASLVSEETFKLLTSPTYFNSLHWRDRRDLLLSVCGDVSDEAVISSNPDLEELTTILGERSLDDHQKVNAGKKKELNKRIQEIPPRIDELTKSIPEQTANPEELRQRVWEIDKEIDQVRSASSLAGQKKDLSEAQARLAELKHQDQAKRQSWQQNHDQLVGGLKNSIAQAESSLDWKRKSIRDLESNLARLRQEFMDITAREISPEQVCPTCEQPLPDDQVTQAREKAQLQKDEALARINSQGKQKKADLEALQKEISSLEADIKKHRDQLEKISGQSFEGSGLEDDIQKAQAEIDEIRQQITQGSTQADTTTMEQEKQSLLNQLAEISAADKAKIRIEQLKKEERDLAGEYEALEKETYLMEQFIVSKVGMLEEKINSKFTLARFKLFSEQVNGGISETCETLYQGVPYHGGLNRGAQTNVGLDVIKTLSDHYQVKAPVFIDNAEAVTELIDPGTQTVKLIVDENYKTLEVK
jgi:DNA repair exonuclease SbcCD ATPase subunit